MTDPRPAKLSHVDIAEQVANIRDTDDVYRLYRPEWVIVYVSIVPPEGTALDNCQRWFDSAYAGRVHPEDVRFEHVGHGPHAMCQLQLRLPTLKGEWKYVFLAQRFADDQDFADYTIVQRNSKADHELRNYGTLRLAS